MSFKPFKWIKKHPLEAAAIAATAWFGGPMIAGALSGAGAAGAGAAGAGALGAAELGGASIAGSAAAAELAAPLASGGSLAGWGAGAAGGGSALLGANEVLGASSLLGEGTLPSHFANMIAGGMGPSDFTAAMAGDAFMPGALGPTGTGTPSMGSKMGSLLASGNGANPRQALQLAQMMGQGAPESRPMGAPVDSGNPMMRQAQMTQEQITKKWLLENDPNTYARIYGSPQPMGA